MNSFNESLSRDRHSSTSVGTPLTAPMSSAVDSGLQELKASGKQRFQWIDHNAFYYEDLKNFFRFHVPTQSRVLEIGYGVGPILDDLQPSLGVGLELSEATLAEAKKRYPKLSFSQWDGAQHLPQDLKSKAPMGFDYILLVNCTGFWPDIQWALQELAPYCHAHTRIIATYYNFLWSPLFKLAERLKLKMPQPNLNWLSASDVSNLFRISGYRVVKSGYRCLLPTPMIPKQIPVLHQFARGLAKIVNRYLSPWPMINRLGSTHFVVARPSHKILPESLTVSVVIPARNEMGNVRNALTRMADVQKTRREKYEIIFVEGNSTDDTWKEIQAAVADPAQPKPSLVQICQQKGKGKGDAVREGFSRAKGDLFLILDADLTVPPEDVPKFVDVFCQGEGEFINGCRLVYKMEREAMRPINLMGNKFFSWAFTWLLGQRFKDTLCGTKVISRQNYETLVAGRKYFGNFDPFGDFDLIFGASKLDLEITEVPIRYRDRTYGETNISRWKHGWLLLKMCAYAMNKIKLVP